MILCVLHEAMTILERRIIHSSRLMAHRRVGMGRKRLQVGRAGQHGRKINMAALPVKLFQDTVDGAVKAALRADVELNRLLPDRCAEIVGEAGYPFLGNGGHYAAQ